MKELPDLNLLPTMESQQQMIDGHEAECHHYKNQITQLTRQNQELMAQVELMVHAVKNAATWQKLRGIISATPTQCLAEVKAQAGRDGFIAGLRIRSKGPCMDFDLAADEYANQLRQQLKGE